MSSYDPRRLARAAALLSMTFLSGCFHPLYSQDLRGEMAAITVDPVPERLGHYLGNALIFAFNGGGAVVAPKYRLVVTPRERVQTPLVDTVTGRATSATVLVDAEYKLIPASGGDPLTSGVAFTAADYDRSSQRFANIRAARDAEIRAADVLSDQIRTRIAAYFASKG